MMLIIIVAFKYLKFSLTIFMYCLEQFLLFKSDALMDVLSCAMVAISCLGQHLGLLDIFEEMLLVC